MSNILVMTVINHKRKTEILMVSLWICFQRSQKISTKSYLNAYAKTFRFFNILWCNILPTTFITDVNTFHVFPFFFLLVYMRPGPEQFLAPGPANIHVGSLWSCNSTYLPCFHGEYRDTFTAHICRAVVILP